MKEKTKELINALEACAADIGGGSGEPFNRSVENAPLLLRQAVDEIKDVLEENAMIVTENDILGARIRFYKRQMEWLNGAVDCVIREYEHDLKDLREICDEK